MGNIEKRLEELGIELPLRDRKGRGNVAVKRCGDLLFVSGQLPLKEDGTLLYEGKVGAELTTEEGYQAARLCGVNALGCVQDAIGDLDRIDCVIKIFGLVSSAPDFFSQPAVINGFSDLLVEVLGERGMHARSAMGTNVLPKNAPVTIDAIIKLR